MSRRPSGKALLLVALLVLMINLPLVHSTWLDWRVDRAGVEVEAEVTGVGVLPPESDPHYVVAFRFPAEVDPDRTIWNTEVDRATYDEAVAEDVVQVRVLPGRPAAYEVEGQVPAGRVGLVVTVLADLALLAVGVLFWRFRGRLRAPLRAVAVEDVERCRPGVALDRLDGDGLYLIRGEVVEILDDEIVLDLGDRAVHVELAGHRNPVGHQQPAQVRGHLVG
ncbi:hypothetical protein [Nocardioides sp.]|uniref:hypothetical protein n=1 Tax=Nocardioides sp. TaxID=35761 RepID=UPI00356A0C93